VDNYIVEFIKTEEITAEGVHSDNEALRPADINDFFGAAKSFAKSYSISPRDGTVTIDE
jgi:hypothetical protein